MKIYHVTDPEFRPYGCILGGYDSAELCKAMTTIRMPDEGTAYQPSIPGLEDCAVYGALQNRAYGGMPIQIGMCWGYNTKLNCLEYHRDSEVNVGASDFLLLLARQEEIEDGAVDTDKVKAFRVPAGVMVEVRATTLHYAPCQINKDDGFRVAVVLPRGTNTEKPNITPQNREDSWLFARNKWLLAHPESTEATRGAYVGLCGDNIDIEPYI